MELKGIEFLKPYSVNGGKKSLFRLYLVVISLMPFPLITYLFIHEKKSVVSDFTPQIHTKNSVLECSF